MEEERCDPDDWRYHRGGGVGHGWERREEGPLESLCGVKAGEERR